MLSNCNMHVLSIAFLACASSSRSR
jgi:hypothetical protein